MVQEKVLFGMFEFPKIKGLDYLMNKEKPTTDYLFINEPRDRFSMYFELGQKPFEVPKTGQNSGEYCLFEMRRKNRRIYFYCPERVPNRESVMWYFYVELFDKKGKIHLLPGQIRVTLANGCLKLISEKTQFIEILERVELSASKSLS